MAWARLETDFFLKAQVASLSKDAKLLAALGTMCSGTEGLDGILSPQDAGVIAEFGDVDPQRVTAELEAGGLWHHVTDGRVPDCECRHGLGPLYPERPARPDTTWSSFTDVWLIHDYLRDYPARDEEEDG
jgi:hypothetical protein